MSEKSREELAREYAKDSVTPAIFGYSCDPAWRLHQEISFKSGFDTAMAHMTSEKFLSEAVALVGKRDRQLAEALGKFGECVEKYAQCSNKYAQTTDDYIATKAKLAVAVEALEKISRERPIPDDLVHSTAQTEHCVLLATQALAQIQGGDAEGGNEV